MGSNQEYITMATFSQTYTSNTSVTIPAFSQDITLVVVGASGGSGGYDAGSPGGSSGPGRYGVFTLPNSIGRTLTFSMGGQGSNGVSSQSSAPGGSGGSGVASGGTGGRAGPSGSSGGGGGGGGATGVYDSYSNSWIIVAGGGGGGGGAAYPSVPGIDGGAGLGWGGSGGTVPTISSGGSGGNCPTDGSGGGGGGGGASGGGGGNNGYDAGSGNVRAGGGGGGGSGYRSAYCTWTGGTATYFGSGYVTLSYTLSPPTISFSVSPTSIIRGQTATLSWNVTGNIDSISINQGIGAVNSSGTLTVSPQNTTLYTITATGPGGTVSSTANLTVYIPPQTTLSLDDSSIIRGECTTLRWVTTGDATSATINPAIGPVNINGLRQVCPTETITYDIFVTGTGGTDSDSITLTVYQPPTVNLSGPESLNYGQQGTLTYEATYVDISLVITPTYTFRGSTVTGTSVNLSTGDSVNSTIQTQIPYGDTGPFSVTYTIVATGNGGQETKQIIIPINIDETPENFLVPESEELYKDQNPIYTPDTILTNYKILIGGVDIPVEIKADKPILVDLNEQDAWEQIRRIE